MRVCGKKILRLAINVGEIASAAAGNQDLLAGAFRPLQYGYTPSAFSRFRGAKQSSGASS